MDSNRRDGSCQNHCGCGSQLRPTVKRRRLEEPDGEQFYCSNCTRPHEASTSGDEEEFSDPDGELDVGSAMLPQFAPLDDPLASEQGPSSRSCSRPVLNVEDIPSTSTSTSALPPLAAPLKSPTTPIPTANNPLIRVEELGWQEGRPTLSARAGYLLNNARMSDVKFLVGEQKAEVFGHKTILALGSPVFEAQFYGQVGNAVDVIELPDMEPDTFLMFLKYLYTDELERSLDDNQLLNLLRPAKKYIVPHLVDKCSDILMTELRPENIFQILHHAQFYELKKVEGACERYIDRNSESIVRSEEFTNLSKPILEEFLKRDGLNINEEALFQAVLRWARAELQRSSIDINLDNMRNALGDCLKLIRFPTMKKEEFASAYKSTNILSPAEACSVFYYMCKYPHETISPDLIFPTKKRVFAPQQCVVSRFAGEPQEHSLNYRSGEIYNYRINFKADRHVFLKGVNIFSIRCGPQAIYQTPRRDFNGALYLYEKGAPSYEGRKQFNKSVALEPDEPTSSPDVVNGTFRRQFYPVMFDTEIPLTPGKTYTVCVVVSVSSTHSYSPTQPLHTYVGTNEKNKSTAVHGQDLAINFTFLGSSVDGSVGRFTSAQIPELIFCL